MDHGSWVMGHGSWVMRENPMTHDSERSEPMTNDGDRREPNDANAGSKPHEKRSESYGNHHQARRSRR